MKDGFYNNRIRQGFTMMEVLATVIIIGILAAIAIPNAVAAQKRLHMAKLDEYARQIYLEAQNETTKMKASGQLEAFYKEIEEGYKAALCLENLPAPLTPKAPQDYPANDTSWKLLYYLPSGNPLAAKYFQNSGSLLANAAEKGGSFILEINPLTGDVYSAFYSEGPAMSYQALQDLATRSRQDRQSLQIGYYNGEAGSSAAVLPGKFQPKLELDNGEDLTARITCSGMLRLNSTQRKLTMKVAITDESLDGNGQPAHAWVKEYKGGTGELAIVGDTARVNLVLDSYDPANRFAQVTGGELTPGDDITVTVEFSYDNGDIHITGSDQKKANSLFAYRKKTTVEGVEGTEIGVSNVRQLNNLRHSIYAHALPGPVQVVQTRDIDYAAAGQAISPAFPAISNPSLFERQDVGTTYRGGNNKLSNFSFVPNGQEGGNATSSNCGLFSDVENCSLDHIQMVDCKATGQPGSQVGMLVGNAVDSTITGCGVYLNTKDGYGRPLGDKVMKEHMAKFRVDGGGSQAAGGLAGQSLRTSLVNCFGAVEVNGNGGQAAGGLAGSQSGGSITGCYSSGNVVMPASPGTSASAGGLVGQAAGGAQISGCYSTSNVLADGAGGGFIGTALGANIAQSMSYGRIARSDGTVPAQAPRNLGGFLGASLGSSFASCSFLKQPRYNDSLSANWPNGVSPKVYRELKSDTVNPVLNGDPYSIELRGNPFPFQLITTDAGNIMVHHGDWPPELRLQTSLVYYERYEDNTYGYYARTSLTTGDDASGEGGTENGQDQANINNWVVDSLKDQVCMEDGYGLLTTYALTELSYELNKDPKDQSPLAHRADVNNDPEQAKQEEASRLATGVQLVFKSQNEDGAPIEYTINNANVYRLPFALQASGRVTAKRFYDRLTMTGKVEANTVFENYIFYYCPDFAKNAINPDLGNPSVENYPPDPDHRPGKNPVVPYVYVRSARQLNALGRTPYYWNNENISNDVAGDARNRELYFKQETDIDFGKYVKTYCGTAFDLMDTRENNPYRNQPIGLTESDRVDGVVVQNFRYVYDGSGHKIIDYCLQVYPGDGIRFAGLFGEVRHATLKNIVMVASDPENASGYVRSASYKKGLMSSGVGALAGLVYVGDRNEYTVQDPTKMAAKVENCAVSGYQVLYNRKNTRPGGTAPNAVSVGGLAGFSFGDIKNCSAVNKEVGIDMGNAQGSRMLVGGLAGSIEGLGKIDGSYAGGELTCRVSNPNQRGNSIGGICAGNSGISPSNIGNKNAQNITNSYSYCTWDPGILDLGDGFEMNIAPPAYGKTSNCYYLEDVVGQGITIIPKDGVAGLALQGLRELTLPGSGTVYVENTHPWPEDQGSLEGLNYPFPGQVQLVDQDGNPDGTFVHYGSWPETRAPGYGANLCYYEACSDQEGHLTYGFYYYDSAGNLVDTLDYRNEKEVKSSGYGILCSPGKNFNFYYDSTGDDEVDTAVSGDGDALLSLDALTDYNGLSLYPFKPDFLNGNFNIIPGQGGPQAARAVAISRQLPDGSDSAPQKFWLNTLFAANIFNGNVNNLPADEKHEAQIRTASQLKNLKDYGRKFDGNWEFNQTHDIRADQDTGGIINKPDGGNATGFLYNGYNKETKANNEVKGLEKPLFEINNGTIRHVAVSQAKIIGTVNEGGGWLAGFAMTNSGTIDNCSIGGSVSAPGAKSAAGFVGRNYGTITNSAARCDVTAGSDPGQNQSAAGFAGENLGQGKIENCSARGTVEGAFASGFVMASGSRQVPPDPQFPPEDPYMPRFQTEISNCFATGTVTTSGSGENVYAAGFAGMLLYDASISGCYSNCKVSYKTPASGSQVYANASGFVYLADGKIEDSYAVGTAKAAEGFASGFAYTGIDHAQISNCYTIVDLEGNDPAKAIGFAYDGGGSVKDCYWVSSRSFNPGLGDNGIGTGLRRLSQLGTALAGPPWTLENAGHTHPDAMAGAYPYPRLTNLDHYGDWPVDQDKVVQIGVYQVFGPSHWWDRRPDFVSGKIIDLDDLSWQGGNLAVNQDGYGAKRPWEFGVIFSASQISDLKGWSAACYKSKYPDGQLLSALSSIDPTDRDTSPYGNGDGNALNGYMLFRFPVDGGGQGQLNHLDYILLMAPDNTSYRFDYNESSHAFTYAGIQPAN